MRILCKVRATVGAIPRSRVRRDARRYLAAALDCRKAQQQALQRLIALNGQSEFARDHRLDEVRTLADLQQRIPITDYDYYAEHIERLKNGDHRAMLGPDNRLLMFALTSGTTSDSKFIPITERFLADYRQGWQIWGIGTLDAHPAINSCTIVQLSSDYDRFRTLGGTPCGNISGLVAAMQKRIVRTMYTVPGAVAKIADPEAKNYTAMRLAVADDNVGMVLTANPSTLIHLAKLAEANSEELIRDIADGTLSRRFEVRREVRRSLGWKTGIRRRRRARELEAIVEREGRLWPRDYWPNLSVVAVWTGGSAGAYLSSLRRMYGDATVRDHGLSASEGRMTIPYEDERSAGVLDVCTHLFEFVPEAEHDSSDPVVLAAHELEAGQNYFILLTTASGFYRYDICDVVRCVGFHGTTPMLEFLHKGNFISNLTGEKISESQVVSAVTAGVERMNLQLEHFTVSPAWGDPPSYQLLVEQCDLDSVAESETLAKLVDTKLQQLNFEYREKRTSGRLNNLSCLMLPGGTWARFAETARQRLGGSFEQYKHPCLVAELNFGDKLAQQSAEQLTPANHLAPRTN